MVLECYKRSTNPTIQQTTKPNILQIHIHNRKYPWICRSFQTTLQTKEIFCCPCFGPHYQQEQHMTTTRTHTSAIWTFRLLVNVFAASLLLLKGLVETEGAARGEGGGEGDVEVARRRARCTRRGRQQDGGGAVGCSSKLGEAKNKFLFITWPNENLPRKQSKEGFISFSSGLGLRNTLWTGDWSWRPVELRGGGVQGGGDQGGGGHQGR